MRLADLATFITGKNAGPFLLAVDVVFSNATAYRRVKEMGVVNAEAVAKRW